MALIKITKTTARVKKSDVQQVIKKASVPEGYSSCKNCGGDGVVKNRRKSS